MKKTASLKKSSNFILNVGIFLILLAVLAVLFFPRAAKAILTAQLTKLVGLPVTIREMDFSLTEPQFLINGLLFANPHGFPAAELAQISKVKVQYVPSFAMLGRFNLKRVEVNFKELRLVRNQKGTINLPLKPPTQAVGDMIIDEVVLNLGPLTYTDLSGKEPVQKTFDMGLNQAIYRNVKGVAGIMEIVSWEVLKRTGLEAKAEPKEQASKQEMKKPVLPTVPAPIPQNTPAAKPAEAPAPQASKPPGAPVVIEPEPASPKANPS